MQGPQIARRSKAAYVWMDGTGGFMSHEGRGEKEMAALRPGLSAPMINRGH